MGWALLRHGVYMLSGSVSDLQQKFYGGYLSRGYEQITGLGVPKSLTVPPNAGAALIQATTQSVRYRDDLVNPSSTVGMVLASGDSMWYTGDLGALRFIETAASAVINVLYYS